MINTYTCGDDNTAFLLKKYQHLDNISNSLRVFLKYEDDKIFAKTYAQLISDKTNRLSEKIYYFPSNSPNISNADVTLGTAWDEWHCPTFDNEYFEINGKIYIKKIQREEISLDLYENLLVKEIQNNLQNIYNNNNQVYFSCSKGIDSMTILSFIIKNGWQHKTTLIRFSNFITKKSSKEFDFEKKFGFKNYEYYDVKMDDLVDAVNAENYAHLQCYTTRKCLKNFPNSSVIFGFHGNQVLLHKKIFLEQINRKVTKNGYVSGCNNWMPCKEKSLSLHHYRLSYQKPWKELNGLWGSRIYDPLGSENVFSNLRAISWRDVDPHIVSDAIFCKNIIRKNVSTLLDNYNEIENQDEQDILVGDLLVNITDIKDTLFKINGNIKNNTQGLNWLLHQYNEARALGFIKLNVLMSFVNIKNLLG